jgi:hypothetical protein
MKRELACLMISALSTPGIVLAQSAWTKLPTEPSTFYPDDRNAGFDEVDPPSDAVLDALLKTPEARENSDELRKLNREGLRKLFLVVRVHLKDTNETDEVVLGHNPMSGADCDWFWIVRDNGGRAQVLLYEYAYGVYLLQSKTDGNRDIRSVGFAGGTEYTNIYHYDGQRYVAVHQYHKEIKP